MNTIKGVLLEEGETKNILAVTDNPNLVIVESTDDIVAIGVEKSDVIQGKAKFANETTCNVFEFLKKKGIDTVFQKKVDDISFLALKCEMIPIEVVVRRIALGSYLERNQEVEGGHFFKDLVVEFFLKTKNKRFRKYQLPFEDPYVHLHRNVAYIYDPHEPINGSMELIISQEYICGEVPINFIRNKLEKEAKRIFKLLEEAWKHQGYLLADLKIEFGFDSQRDIVLADSINNGSWRVLNLYGNHMDKQLYRDGEDLEKVRINYRRVAELTARFCL